MVFGLLPEMDAAGKESSDGAGSADLYAVLGLKKECTDAELKIAYKKLAMRWHPDRCSAAGNSKCVEEAKEKFQQIQGAYSVLSDSNKRFLYDVGVYDSDDDENNVQGMGDFLGEMAEMMSQARPNGNGQDSFEELQQLFVDMFQTDLNAGFCGPPMGNNGSRVNMDPFVSSSSSPSPPPPPPEMPCCNGGNNKRDSSAMTDSGKSEMSDYSSAGFCFGKDDLGQQAKGRSCSDSKRRNGRKQKISLKQDVSSCDAEFAVWLYLD